MNSIINNYECFGDAASDDDNDDEYDFIAIIKNKNAYDYFVKHHKETTNNFNKVCEMVFEKTFNEPIDNLPSQIKIIKIHKQFTYIDSIPETVTRVVMKKK